MFGFSASHLLIFGIVTVVLFRNWLRSISRQAQGFVHDFVEALRDKSFRFHHRGSSMRKHWNKFLWTWKFWALLGAVGCVSGLYFQRVAENGSGLWCLGLIFLGAAYLEQQE